MTTPIQQKIRNKKRTAKQILDMVKSGDWIQPGTPGGDATECMVECASRLGPSFKDIEFWLYGNIYPHPYFQQADPKQKYHCMNDYFFFPWNRKARDTNGVSSWAQWGWAMGQYFHHYRFVNAVKEKRGIDWWWNAATVPEEHGFFNWSYGVSNANIYSQTAKQIVVEVRADFPWAEAGRFTTIHIDDIDYWVEVDVEKNKWPQMNEKAIKPSPDEAKIAEHILTIMRDRDIIQLGIGSLPSAVATALAGAGLKDLGIHTEMLNFGLINLLESGQVTNKYKTLPFDRGKSVWTLAFPFDTKWYYDTVHRNPRLAAYDIGYTNNLHNLTRLDNMIAINNAMSVDLLGQVCCGFYDKRPISSTGGFLQFVGFCSQSRGGRGVVSLTSRSKHGTSRIVPFFPAGTTVDLPAQLTSHVCTEFGIVNLRGLNGYERTEAIISIAHPDDRAALEKEAREYGLLAPEYPVKMLPKEGGDRRYPSYDERRQYKSPFNSDMWGFDWDPYQSGK